MTEDDCPPDGFPLVVTTTTPGVADIKYWMLIDRVPTRVSFFEHLEHIVAAEEDPLLHRVDETLVGDARVSTVFIPLIAASDEHFPFGKYHFETMVFGGRHDLRTCRYLTWEDAQAGHDRMVARLIDEMPSGDQSGIGPSAGNSSGM